LRGLPQWLRGVALWDAKPAGWQFKSQLEPLLLKLCEDSQLPLWWRLTLCPKNNQLLGVYIYIYTNLRVILQAIWRKCGTILVVLTHVCQEFEDSRKILYFTSQNFVLWKKYVLKTSKNSTNNMISVEAAKEHCIWDIAKLTHLIGHISHVLILFWINNCNMCVFFLFFCFHWAKDQKPITEDGGYHPWPPPNSLHCLFEFSVTTFTTSFFSPRLLQYTQVIVARVTMCIALCILSDSWVSIFNFLYAVSFIAFESC